VDEERSVWASAHVRLKPDTTIGDRRQDDDVEVERTLQIAQVR
jgi:hypothetical protein